MKYFKYRNTDKTHKSALKAQYKALNESEKRIVRKEKMWRRILNILIYLFYLAFRVLSIRIEKKVNYFYEVTTSD